MRPFLWTVRGDFPRPKPATRLNPLTHLRLNGKAARQACVYRRLPEIKSQIRRRACLSRHCQLASCSSACCKLACCKLACCKLAFCKPAFCNLAFCPKKDCYLNPVTTGKFCASSMGSGLPLTSKPPICRAINRRVRKTKQAAMRGLIRFRKSPEVKSRFRPILETFLKSATINFTPLLRRAVAAVCQAFPQAIQPALSLQETAHRKTNSRLPSRARQRLAC